MCISITNAVFFYINAYICNGPSNLDQYNLVSCILYLVIIVRYMYRDSCILNIAINI
jgi:hypothetical protein